MPGLHFLPGRDIFASPCALLTACMLYCSSSLGPETANLAPEYLTVLGHALSQLSIPNSPLGRRPEEALEAEHWAFQTVLAIVLAGLLCEASIPEVGIWISIAYRLMLEHCPHELEEQSKEWRNLFVGLQTIDLEHASLHLSCPVIPTLAPIRALQTSARDHLPRLSRIMHGGLIHFTGRGLPTIWSCFTGSQFQPPGLAMAFTATDAAVLRDWARQLDDWLLEVKPDNEGPPEKYVLVFRQYILHRLTILSIYHPARGCDFRSQTMSPVEQYELLLSARAALQLHITDSGIWCNFDLVMISWAALIAVQGLEAGFGVPDGSSLHRP